MFCALIKTKSAHAKLQSIKNAWSKDEIWCLEMAALLAQGNNESGKYRFNTTFLTGSDYYRYPRFVLLSLFYRIMTRVPIVIIIIAAAFLLLIFSFRKTKLNSVANSIDNLSTGTTTLTSPVCNALK